MAEEKREWELKSAKNVADALEWLRRRTKGRALVLVAIGTNSIAYTKDPQLSPKDAAELLQQQLSSLRGGFEEIHRSHEPKTRGVLTRGEPK